jgi:nicotinate-nucleotide adenylyltransferase
MQKSAILGGTFNPIHCGHLEIARAAFKQFQLDQVIWVPAYHPPHKSALSIFVLSTMDQAQAGQSYAVHTLRTLQSLYPQQEWYWILGLDAFRSLPQWYARQEMAAHCCWLVAPRPEPGLPLPQTLEFAYLTSLEVEKTLAAQSITLRWQLLHLSPLAISSSLVRRYCWERRSIEHLVPQSVQLYILNHQLYQSADA